MDKYTCTICGYVYDESKGSPDEGIAPETKWESLTDDWVCPVCGATKDAFEIQADKAANDRPTRTFVESHDDMKELRAIEVSAICFNLSNAYNKMHQPEEEEKFRQLGEYFKAAAAPAEEPSYSELLDLVDQDISGGIPNAEAMAQEVGDRGSLRALTWTNKASRMLKSLINRYEKEGESMVENTGVYVCSICGYIYIGDDLPDVCPVCKVPNWKFDKITGGAA